MTVTRSIGLIIYRSSTRYQVDLAFDKERVFGIPKYVVLFCLSAIYLVTRGQSCPCSPFM